MMFTYDRKIKISTAGSRKAIFWQPQEPWWSEFVGKLRVPDRGTEPLAVFLSHSKSKQDEIKDNGGYLGGLLNGNRRKADNVISRDIITLDLDNIPAGGTQDVLRRIEGLGCAYAVYSTRKHEESRPRLRVIVPTDRSVTADEYEPIGRKIGEIIDIKLCDPTTFEASRLMYWPSCCSDSSYVYRYGDKPFLSADGILSMYKDWRNVSEWPQVPGVQQTHVKVVAKQGNPIEKTGVVGAFCKTYDVYKAMETFLPGVYIPCEDGSGRFTYSGGSTTGGAVVYENGNFLYSHHSTDPAGGKLCNAFDLVRMHKFSEMDDEAKIDTPVNKLPSYTAMSQLAASDTQVAAILNAERYEKATQAFSEDIEDDAHWTSKLKISFTNGAPLKTGENVLILLENDPKIKGRIRLNSFEKAVMGFAPLPWAPRDSEEDTFRWIDEDDSGLRLYVEKILGFKGRDSVQDALSQCAAKNQFNPVTAYLNSLTWDGVRRLDRLYIDYLGAADTPYVRAVTRKSHVAAVARATKPGIKYDTMPVLTGAQGLGKTTLIQKMGQQWFSNSIDSFEGKEASELLKGVWIVEIGEMSAYNRSDLEVIKGFLSRCDDQYRAAYARKTEKHLRCCVFFGTSNRDDYLRDTTGSRRFWPVDVGVQKNIKSVFTDLDGEIDQLWAEAVFYWKQGESLHLTGELEEEAKRQQESHSETDAREGVIRDFMERSVPSNWSKRSVNERKIYWSGEYGRGDNSEMVERDRICAAEVWVECLGGDFKLLKRADVLIINRILESTPGWQKCKGPYRFGPYGLIKGGYLKG
jgi:putative DNA primase/helicase